VIWIFLGPPGAGKGTQAKLLAAHLGVPHISTGDLLREAIADGTELGRLARGYMEAGDLVPDDLLLGLVREALEGPAAKGCILDGYPRNTHQAEALTELAHTLGHPVCGVIELEVSEGVLVDRIAARARAEARADDTEETVRRRLRVYEEQTSPLVAYYRDRGLLHPIAGEGSIDAIRARVFRVAGNHEGRSS
jgi:adenylate kinase